MKYRVDELEGALLDRAVSQALGYDYAGVCYTLVWDFAGPIIERERISILAQVVTHSGVAENRIDKFWEARTEDDISAFATTPLIAAMRCFVKSCLGPEVELPTIGAEGGEQ